MNKTDLCHWGKEKWNYRGKKQIEQEKGELDRMKENEMKRIRWEKEGFKGCGKMSSSVE